MLRVALVFRDWLSECLLLFFASLTLNWKRFDLCCTEGPWPLLFLLITAGVEWFFLIWEEEVVFDALDFAPGILYVLLCFVVDVNIFFTESVWSVLCFSTCFCVLAVIIFDFTCVYFLFVLNGVCVFFLKDKTSPWTIDNNCTIQCKYIVKPNSISACTLSSIVWTTMLPSLSKLTPALSTYVYVCSWYFFKFYCFSSSSLTLHY